MDNLEKMIQDCVMINDFLNENLSLSDYKEAIEKFENDVFFRNALLFSLEDRNIGKIYFN